MKAKDIPCRKCGGKGRLTGDILDDCEGPFAVICQNCGEETIRWVLPREAWKQWKIDNKEPVT